MSSRYTRRDAAAWSIAQYVVTRASAAAGWMLVARNTVPETFGHFTVLLIAVALLEAISMPGLNQAIVQRQIEDKIDLAPAWIIQFARGLVVALVLYGVIRYFYPETFTGLTEPLILLFLAQVVLRNAQSLWTVTLQRANDFRTFFLFELFTAIIEILTLTLLIMSDLPPITAYVLSLTLGAVARLVISWQRQPHRLINARFDAAFAVLWQYSRWIWGTSLLVVAANFTDKIVASTLPASQMGAYQLSSRFAQLVFADWAAAYSAYLFPRMSHMRRTGTLSAFYGSRRALVGFIAALCILIAIISLPANVPAVLFGKSWASVEGLFFLHGATMIVGAAIALLSAGIKARGRPQVIFLALVAQLLVLAASIIPLWSAFGMHGLIYANLLSLLTCVTVLTTAALRMRS